MKKFGKLVIIFMVLFCAVSFASSAMAGALSYDITDKAELVKIGMHLQNIRKKSDEKAVVFEITIKNTDSAPHLYSVTVIVPGVGGGEGFIPDKGDEKLAPEAEGMASIGIISPSFPTEGYTIIVKEIEAR